MPERIVVTKCDLRNHMDQLSADTNGVKANSEVIYTQSLSRKIL
jgi:hypothetical protein